MEYLFTLRNHQQNHRGSLIHMPNTTISISPWPWPYHATLIFDFSVEGTYGGGDSIDVEIEITPSLAKIFENHNVQATFMVLGKIANEYPSIVKKIHERNQDIGGHGYSHRFMDELTTGEQENEILRTRNIISDITGRTIVGWTSPYCISTRTTYEILNNHNFNWTSNWGRSLWGFLPFRPIIEGKEYDLIEIPAEDVHFDNMYRKYNTTPEQVESLWRNHIDQSILHNALFHICAHPVNLVNSREKPILNLLEYAMNSNKVWVASCKQVSDRWRIFENIVAKLGVQEIKDTIIINGEIINNNKIELSDWTIRMSTPHNVKGLGELGEYDIKLYGGNILISLPKISPLSSKTINYEILLDK